MIQVPINYWAVIVAGFINMAIGFFWYGPIFGKQWTMMMGFTKEDMEKAQAKGMAKQYILTIGASLLTSYILAHSLVFASSYFSMTGLFAGLMVGFWSWLGFIIPASLNSVLWEGKSWKLWVLNVGYYLVSLLIMGVILALWI